VVVLRGQGAVLLGGQRHPLAPGDLVLVAADEPHQFHAGAGEPLGFLCVVDSERDVPVPVADEGGDWDAVACERHGDFAEDL
jgi:quercetin dioxygenase-like cupin family protein